LPYILQFSEQNYDKEIRKEAAYFIGQIISSKQTILKSLIISGGLKAITNLFDCEYFQNKDLI